MKNLTRQICVWLVVALLLTCFPLGTVTVHAQSNDYIPDVPENDGVRNAILNAEQLANVTFTPLRVLPQKSGNWPSGKEQKGLPYSSSRVEEGFVPNFVSFDTFWSALKNPNSYLYTVDLAKAYNNKNGSTYYGTVCSAFCTYALNIVPNYTTHQWQDIPGMETLPQQTVDALKLGDTICHKTSGHVVMVTGITRNSLGQVGEVTIAEASTPRAMVNKPYTAKEFAAKYPVKTHAYHRYSKISEVQHVPFETANYNADIIPRKGDKANWLAGVPVEIDLLSKSNYSTVEIYKGDTLYDTVAIDHGVELPVDRTVYGLDWEIGNLSATSNEQISTGFISSMDIDLVVADGAMVKIGFYTEEQTVIPITEEWLTGTVSVKDLAPEGAKLCRIAAGLTDGGEVTDVDAIASKIAVSTSPDVSHMPLVLQSGTLLSATGAETNRVSRGRTDFLPLQNVRIDGSDNIQYYVHYYDADKTYLSNKGTWLSGSVNVMDGAPTDAAYFRLVVKNREGTDVASALGTHALETTATILGGATEGGVDVLVLDDLEHGSYKARMTNGTESTAWCYWIVVDATASAVPTDNCREVSVTFSASNAQPLFVKWAGGLDNGTKHITVLSDEEKTEGTAVCKYDCGNINDRQSDQYKIRVAFQTEYGIIHTPLQEVLAVKPHTYTNTCDADCNACGDIRTIKHRYDDACDTNCNVCDESRVITHKYTSATCTKAATCKVCGAPGSEALGHKYTNNCDTSCNRCKSTRKITHDYADATCIKAKTCSECGKTSGKALGHKYTNNCDTSCNRCKATRKITHTYNTTTTKATLKKNGSVVKKCTVCGKVASKTTIKKIKSVKLSDTSYTYNGKVKKPSVVVKDSAGKKISSKYYTVTYAKGCKNVGTYKVTVKFKGNYSGKKVLTFKINPPKATVKKLTAAKKSLKVAITKKTSQVTGYQVQYATSKSFKGAKTKVVKSAKTTSLTIKSLKAKKTYYVRVRTYKKVGKTTYYSGWSTYKTKKTK